MTSGPGARIRIDKWLWHARFYKSRTLAAKIRSYRPALKVLYTSGYADAQGLPQTAAEGTSPFVQKPFTPLALLSKVREVLDQRDGDRSPVIA